MRGARRDQQCIVSERMCVIRKSKSSEESLGFKDTRIIVNICCITSAQSSRDGHARLIQMKQKQVIHSGTPAQTRHRYSCRHRQTLFR
jgi:hypothetical protein